MSLKYRLILLTLVIFAGTFAFGAVLGIAGAKRLAVGQLHQRLQRWASALAASSVPLNNEALDRLAPLLGAHILVIADPSPSGPEVVAHTGGDWPWERLGLIYFGQFPAPRSPEATGGGHYFAAADRFDRATGRHLRVVVFADASVVGESTRAMVVGYLTVLGVASVLLAIGTYVVGLGLVRRVNRLAETVDATLAEGPAARTRGGDELKRLARSFDELFARLESSRQRLAAQQRLATAGKIASMVAHEVRNPLQAMRLTVQMLAARSAPDARAGCDIVLSEIDRLTLMTDELLVLAGKDTRHVESVDLRRELDETLRLLAHQLRQRDIRTESDLPELPPVHMDRNRCRQLLLNLLLNAAEASPHGGTIRVSGQAGDGEAIVRIADHGPGFPPPVLAGQAEEFFSTKTTGAGLGLSICRRIVEEAGGELRLCNADGGAVAEVALPVVASDER